MCYLRSPSLFTHPRLPQGRPPSLHVTRFRNPPVQTPSSVTEASQTGFAWRAGATGSLRRCLGVAAMRSARAPPPAARSFCGRRCARLAASPLLRRRPWRPLLPAAELTTEDLEAALTTALTTALQRVESRLEQVDAKQGHILALALSKRVAAAVGVGYATPDLVRSVSGAERMLPPETRPALKSRGGPPPRSA